MGCHVVSLADTLDRKRHGDKSNKHTFGPIGDGGYFVGPNDPTKPLIVAEGVETLLAAVQLAGGLEKVSGVATCGKVNRLGQLPACSEVIIAADLDKPDKHGELRACLIYDAAKELAERIASYVRVRVRIVESPEAEWNDFNDVLMQARDPQRVWDDALDDAEEIKPAALEDAPAMKTFLAEVYPTQEFLMPPLFLRQGTSQLSARAGHGKTRLALSMSYAMATATPLLGWEVPRPVRVVYVDGELAPAQAQQWVQRLGESNDNLRILSDKRNFRLGLPRVTLQTEQGRDYVAHVIEKHDAEFVVLDALFTLTTPELERTSRPGTW